MQETLKEMAARLAKDLQCCCDLDNWQPDPATGHSHVCRVHKAAVREFYAGPKPRL